MLTWHGTSSLCATVRSSLWRYVKPASIGTPSWAPLWHTKPLSPGTTCPREPDQLLNPSDEQTGPFSSSTYKLLLASLHLLSKRPQTGQHFLHSKAMQGISLLRQLDPFQRRRAPKFPPPAPSMETRCKFGPWRLSVLFHFCPCCLLEVGRKGPSPLPSPAGVECRRERAGSVPENSWCQSSPQMQQETWLWVCTSLCSPHGSCWAVGISLPLMCSTGLGTQAVVSCDLFIFSLLLHTSCYLRAWLLLQEGGC